MGQLNLYKIDAQKHGEFVAAIEDKYALVGNARILERVVGEQRLQFELTFYIDIPYGENRVDWNWLPQYFGDNDITSRSNPKGILVIKKNDEIYACTYGFSFFIVDKYCDTDFAFDFARRIRYKEIKTTTLLSPNLKRNKVVNTYLDYNNLEFDSGESFAKLKVKADLPEDFEIFESGLEAGHSIKFEVPHNTIEAILDVLLYVQHTLTNGQEFYRIPVFNKVSNKETIENLNQRLATNLEKNPLIVNLSELDIIGVTEIFNQNDSLFKVKYGRSEVAVTQLTTEIITEFIQQNGLSLFEGLEKVKIISFYNGMSIRTDELYNLIDYTDDEQRCVLSKGKWYCFNDDYLGYLADSISEIDAIYNPQFDFSTALHEQFIAEKYLVEKNDPIYQGLSQDEIRKKIKSKYYRERAYNLYLSDTYGFSCHDRDEIRVGNATVELMDLAKDETLYAVKIGNASSVLCYALDQSTSTLKLYKHQEVPNLPVTKNFGVWLVLDRRNHLSIIDGKPIINELEMLMLKNKIDAWKKEVRLLGYNPIIMINYFN